MRETLPAVGIPASPPLPAIVWSAVDETRSGPSREAVASLACPNVMFDNRDTTFSRVEPSEGAEEEMVPANGRGAGLSWRRRSDRWGVSPLTSTAAGVNDSVAGDIDEERVLDLSSFQASIAPAGSLAPDHAATPRASGIDGSKIDGRRGLMDGSGAIARFSRLVRWPLIRSTDPGSIAAVMD
jgi:hypothetical protein